jgi:hypothetical protein
MLDHVNRHTCMLPRERLVDIVVVLCPSMRVTARPLALGAKKDTAALQQLVREQPACPASRLMGGSVGFRQMLIGICWRPI